MLSFTYILFHVSCVIRYNSSWTSLMCCSQSWQALFFPFFFSPSCPKHQQLILVTIIPSSVNHFLLVFRIAKAWLDTICLVLCFLVCFFFFNLCRGDCSDCLSCLKQLPVWVLFLNKNTMHTRGKKKKKRFPVISGIMQN